MIKKDYVYKRKRGITHTWFLVLILAVLACNSVIQERTTYYFDPVSGSDSSVGTSPDKPFRSLGMISRLAIKPGDSLLLKSGAVFTGQLYLNLKGEQGKPVVVGKYGGNDRPVLKGEGQYNAEVLIFNSEFLTIRDLDISNKGPGPVDGLNGVLVRLRDFGTARDLRLDNLFVHDVFGGLVKERESGGNAILLKNYDDSDSLLRSSRFDGLIVENCHISNCQRNGIMMWGNWMRKKWNPSLGVIIRNNLIEWVPGDGIVPVACESPIVEYNIMRACPHTLPVSEACDGIWPWSCDNAVVQFNIVSDHGSQVDGYGFDSDWNSSNSLFRYNLSFNNDGGFILICNPGGWPAEWSSGNHGTIVRNNISINDGIRDYLVRGRTDYFSPVIHITGAVRNTLIEKNLFIVSKKQKKEIDRKIISLSDWYGYPDSTIFSKNYLITEELNLFADKGKSENNLFSGNYLSGELQSDPGSFIVLDRAGILTGWKKEAGPGWDELIKFIGDRTIEINDSIFSIKELIGADRQ